MTAQAEPTHQEPLSTAREVELLSELRSLAADCSRTKARVRAALAEGLAQAKKDWDEAVKATDQNTRTARVAAATGHEQATAGIHKQYELDRDAAQIQYKNLRQGVEMEHMHATEVARQQHKRLSWETHALYDARRGQPQERFQQTDKAVQRGNEELTLLENDAVDIMKMRRQWREFPPPNVNNAPSHSENNKAARVNLGRTEGGEQPLAADLTANNGGPPRDNVDVALDRVAELNISVRSAAEALLRQRLTRIYEPGYAFGVFFFLAIAVVACGFSLSWQNWYWAVASPLLAIAAAAAVLFGLWPLVRRQSADQFQQVQQLVAQTRQAMQHVIEMAQVRGQREARELLAERDQQLTAFEQTLQTTVQEKDRWKDAELGRAAERYPARLAELRENMKLNLAEAAKKFNEKLATLTSDHDRQMEEHRVRHDERCRTVRAQYDQDWSALTDRWQEGLVSFQESLGDLTSQCEELFPDWEITPYNEWPRPEVPSAAIRFGQVTDHVKVAEDGLPASGEPRTVNKAFDLPALMTLDEHPVLAIAADEEGRRPAADLMQLVMLRFLTAMPPGKVRFTILDPVGLGENFASFMHLADFDELLIASRIWTDGRQIEEQLTRLTAHMETVLQKYLRNEFATIYEYNEQAGEVAEPFQVVVAANFPTNFSESAARKLASIVTSGPRCGVYTLVSVDRKQRLPTDFDVADLLSGAVHLEWRAEEGGFLWRHKVFEKLPLAVDPLPSAERLNDVIRQAGRAAKDSMKVEVPFELVAPDKDKIWTDSSSKEMVVPIGRAGAMRLQSVRLGRGTSQHLLVCGKTGSGKSTFLHALITNAALHFSPDEVEFYLIDFKKGVEFKTYATHRLPHARVIAIESEREFGLSVLERLDAELRRRGDLLRSAGVQDLPDYRAARPDEKMPRVLLVVDEFQELFVEDDKLSQESALLLDRLVRQGRAFGIHVLLGSQTLSGAYSLARSTMGQMAVRVALQCSETDAALILSDERNSAARFLNRPGDAIYNDQNGLLAGNSPFQVVWLSEAQRIGYLRQIEAKAEASGAPPAHTIVFEGDQLADPSSNPYLRELLSGTVPANVSGEQKAWLGDAVAIKEPTFATFGRHAGSNLLVVGAWDESALGVMANAVIALAAQNANCGLKESDPQSEIRNPKSVFYVLDGTRPDSPEAGAWQRVADALPNMITLAGPRDAPRIINDLSTELAQREAETRDDAPPIYLVIFNGGRFRDLRRGEDDYSFSFDKDKPARADKQFADIIKNGPGWGIHSLVWCDSYNNVSRMLDRGMLREFELRIAFQMSAADSASLLDNPAATRLRQHRGLFASEDVGTLEKFRPYGPPSDEWLENVRRSLVRKA